MKKYTILVLFTFLVTSIFAQRGRKPVEMEMSQIKHVLKANPITLAFGDFNATWEVVLTPKSSLTLTGNFITGAFDSEFFGLALTAGYKYYFTNSKIAVPEGFYVRPLAGILLGEGEGGIRVGGQLGYQWIWNSGFVLDIGLGPQVVAIEEGVEGPLPSFFLGIGYAF